VDFGGLEGVDGFQFTNKGLSHCSRQDVCGDLYGETGFIEGHYAEADRGNNVMDYHDFCGIRQWVWDRPESPKELTPYQKLLLALLMDAVETLKRPPKAIVNRYIGKRQYKVKEPASLDPIGEANDWLMSDDKSTLGFCSICEYFDWDPKRVRERALEAINNANRGDILGNRNRHLALPGPRSRRFRK
jgi:hypothetical protein